MWLWWRLMSGDVTLEVSNPKIKSTPLDFSRSDWETLELSSEVFVSGALFFLSPLVQPISETWWLCLLPRASWLRCWFTGTHAQCRSFHIFMVFPEAAGLRLDGGPLMHHLSPRTTGNKPYGMHWSIFANILEIRSRTKSTSICSVQIKSAKMVQNDWSSKNLGNFNLHLPPQLPSLVGKYTIWPYIWANHQERFLKLNSTCVFEGNSWSNHHAKGDPSLRLLWFAQATCCVWLAWMEWEKTEKFGVFVESDVRFFRATLEVNSQCVHILKMYNTCPQPQTIMVVSIGFHIFT